MSVRQVMDEADRLLDLEFGPIIDKILKVIPKTRIIAFSTADQETMIVQALDAGCCSFVNKPFKGEDLLKAIHQAQAVGSSSEVQGG